MKITPINDQVLIKIDSEEKKSAGGLFLVSLDPVLKNSGVVFAVGDSDVISVVPGDHVVFEKGMGKRFEIPCAKVKDGATWTENDSFILISFYDVIAVLKD